MRLACHGALIGRALGVWVTWVGYLRGWTLIDNSLNYSRISLKCQNHRHVY